MQRRRVVLTGAAGIISHKLLAALRERYDPVLLDVTRESRWGTIDDVVIADLTDPDLDAYRTHFGGADAIVHNGFVRDPARPSNAPLQWLEAQPPNDPDSYFPERTNVDMAFNIYKLALQEGVRRVVVTSSNHAADWYETHLHRGAMDVVGPEHAPLSNNMYGWAKVAYEQLGFGFATGRYGRAVENVQIRIGAPRRIAGDHYLGQPTTFKRDLGAFISLRDLQQLYIKSIETEDIRNEDGVPWQVFYGISNNTRAFWSLVNARRVIGYAPQDDSEVLFRDEIDRILSPPAARG
jgi:nucleoside-diphosphate-sugar epimerase